MFEHIIREKIKESQKTDIDHNEDVRYFCDLHRRLMIAIDKGYDCYKQKWQLRRMFRRYPARTRTLIAVTLFPGVVAEVINTFDGECMDVI